MLEDVASRYGFSLDEPVKNLPTTVFDVLLRGESAVSAPEKNSASDSRFEGIIPNLERRWKETDSEWTRAEIERYMRLELCPACTGRRLKPEALAVLLQGKSIADVSACSASDAIAFMRSYERTLGSQRAKAIAK